MTGDWMNHSGLHLSDDRWLADSRWLSSLMIDDWLNHSSDVFDNT